MAHRRILFADDQIPEDGIPDETLNRTLREKYPGEDENSGFILAFREMRIARNVLQSAGYEVVVARAVAEAKRLAADSRFDIAIVDLRWDGDLACERHKRDVAGWEICWAIDEADKKHGGNRTFQIVYSSRFNKEIGIAMRAAHEGRLPIYKGYTDASAQALLATIQWVDHNVLMSRDTLEATRQSEANVHHFASYLLTSSSATPATSLTRLREFLVEHYNDEEFRTLCADLDVNYDALAATGLDGKARELISYLKRRNRLTDLVHEIAKARPGA